MAVPPPTDAELDTLATTYWALLGIDISVLPVSDPTAVVDQARCLTSARSTLRGEVAITEYAASTPRPTSPSSTRRRSPSGPRTEPWPSPPTPSPASRPTPPQDQPPPQDARSAAAGCCSGRRGSAPRPSAGTLLVANGPAPAADPRPAARRRRADTVRAEAIDDPTELTMAEALTLFQRGRLTPTELMEAYLDRIDRFEADLPGVQRPPTRARAAGRRRRRWAAGRRGASSCGARPWRRRTTTTPTTCSRPATARCSPTSSPTTTRPAWPGCGRPADWSSARRRWGRWRRAGRCCRAPTSRRPATPGAPTTSAYSPSGSSGGTATAVAARLATSGIGTQTGGSITSPGQAQGLTAFKPTFGRTSLYGVIPLTYTRDHTGPLARDAKDAAIMLQALAGRRPPRPPDDRHAAGARLHHRRHARVTGGAGSSCAGPPRSGSCPAGRRRRTPSRPRCGPALVDELAGIPGCRLGRRDPARRVGRAPRPLASTTGEGTNAFLPTCARTSPSSPPADRVPGRDPAQRDQLPQGHAGPVRDVQAHPGAAVLPVRPGAGAQRRRLRRHRATRCARSRSGSGPTPTTGLTVPRGAVLGGPPSPSSESSSLIAPTRR